MFTGFISEEYFAESMAKGAEGFLLKDCTRDEMVYAVLSVFKGEVYFPKSIRISNKFFDIEKSPRIELLPLDSENSLDTLTPREIEVMELVERGLDSKKIANYLGVTAKAIDYHVSNIISKLGVGSRLEAAVYWVKFKIIKGLKLLKK